MGRSVGLSYLKLGENLPRQNVASSVKAICSILVPINLAAKETYRTASHGQKVAVPTFEQLTI